MFTPTPWVLIWIIVTSTGGATSGTAEFGDRAACQVMVDQIAKGIKSDQVNAMELCYPKYSK